MRLWKSSGTFALIVGLLKAAQDVSGYHNSRLGGILWVLLAVLVVVVLGDLAVPEFWKFLMPMPDAAKLAYSYLRKKGQSHLIEKWAGGDHESVLGLTQQYLVDSSASIYGKRAPSVLHEKIDKDEFKSLTFREHGAVLTRYGDETPIYTDVCVNRWAMRWAVRGIGKSFKEYSDRFGKK